MTMDELLYIVLKEMCSHLLEKTTTENFWSGRHNGADRNSDKDDVRRQVLAVISETKDKGRSGAFKAGGGDPPKKSKLACEWCDKGHLTRSCPNIEEYRSNNIRFPTFLCKQHLRKKGVIPGCPLMGTCGGKVISSPRSEPN